MEVKEQIGANISSSSYKNVKEEEIQTKGEQMKTELETAKDNLKSYEDVFEDREGDINWSFCCEHKRTCERWLDFLENHLIFIREARKDCAGLQPFQYPISDKIKELRKAIKLYKEFGI